jgi:uncharacterized protein YfiM (DUF2279 family)
MNDKLKHAIAGIALLMLTASLSAQIPYDKKLHAGAGVVIGTWGTFAGNSMNWKPEKAALFGMGSVAVAGLGKELWDEIEYGGWDWKDLGATMIGGTIGTGLSYAALKIFKKKPYIYVGNVRNNLTIGVKLII